VTTVPALDIVVDTNVLVHASNEAHPYCHASLAFLSTLLAGTTVLCVDEGFSADESKNASLIGAEYTQHLVFGMPGYAVVQALASTDRLKQVARSVPDNVRRAVKRLVPRNSRDRTFVHVAFNSTDRLLVSHDFDDFGGDIRKKLRQSLGVSIVIADDATPRV